MGEGASVFFQDESFATLSFDADVGLLGVVQLRLRGDGAGTLAFLADNTIIVVSNIIVVILNLHA